MQKKIIIAGRYGFTPEQKDRVERQDQCMHIARKHGKADPTSYSGRGRSMRHTHQCRGEP